MTNAAQPELTPRRKLHHEAIAGASNKGIPSYLKSTYEEGFSAAQTAEELCRETPHLTGALTKALRWQISSVTLRGPVDKHKIIREHPELTAYAQLNKFYIADFIKTPTGQEITARMADAGIEINLDVWSRTEYKHLSNHEFYTQAVQLIWCIGEYISECKAHEETRDSFDVAPQFWEDIHTDIQNAQQEREYLQCDFPPGYLEIMAAAQQSWTNR